MKKIITLLALFCFITAGWAQVVTDRASAGSPMTFDQFKALAGTGKHFAIVASSSNSLVYPKWFSFSSAGYPEILTTVQLFDLENSATGDGWYNIKRVSDGLYVSTEGGNFADSPKMDFKLVNRIAGDYAPEFGALNLHISLDNAAGNHYNANTVNLGFRAGTGGYSTYVAYGPFHVVSVNYLDENDDPIQAAETFIVADGAVLNAPSFAGKAVQGTSSATINADQTVTFKYATSSYDYALVVNGAPTGTTMTIKGDDVALDAGSVSFSNAVAASDVVVTFPTGYEYLTANVTISGTTITVNCEDTRWPINFSKDQKYTRTDRFINNVRIGSKTFEITNNGLNTPAYRDFTNEVLVVPAGATLVPAIGYTGAWMHGFFYVDLDNDGQFYVANPGHQTAANTEPNGELLSYANEGDALNSSHQEMPAFTMPNTPGDYRARFKLDWASTDPGGNPGADANDVTSKNHIIANGGTIVDITLRILPPANVTYVVVDENSNELFRTTEALAIGDVVTTLPTAYQHTAFYDYNTVNETITGDTEITFTATTKTYPLVRFTLDDTNPVWYTLKMKNANYVTYVTGETPNVILPTTKADDPDLTTQWAFIGSPYVGFKIVNHAAGTGLVLGSESAAGDGNNGGNTYATLAVPGTQTYETWTIRASSYLTSQGGFYIYNSEGQYLNQRSTDNLAYWTGGHDEGSTFTATLAPGLDDIFNNAIATLEAYPYGAGVNHYSLVVGGEDKTANAADEINNLKGLTATLENIASAQQLIAGTTLNLPEPGFYRILGNTSGKYLAAGMAANDKFAMTDATDATTVFYFDGSKLVNYSTGMANGMNKSAWAWVTGESASVVTFQDGLTNGGYGIMSASDAGGTLNANFYDNGDGTDSADRGGNVTINSGTNARYTNWYLEPVNELPLALTDLGSYGVSGCYTTMYMPVNVQVTGATVYAVTGATGNSLNVEEITDGVVPANTGVILEGTATSATATVCTTASTATSVLSGSIYVTEIVPTNTCVLSVANDKLGFYKFEGAQLKGFRTYYVATSADPTRGFVLNFGETTGINAATRNADGNAYDLQGRRVQNAQKGIFIINGKKVVK